MTNVNMGRLGATLFAVGLSLALASEPVLAQTVIATPLPNAKQTFVDANGKPLSRRHGLFVRSNYYDSEDYVVRHSRGESKH